MQLFSIVTVDQMMLQLINYESCDEKQQQQQDNKIALRWLISLGENTNRMRNKPRGRVWFIRTYFEKERTDEAVTCLDPSKSAGVLASYFACVWFAKRTVAIEFSFSF